MPTIHTLGHTYKRTTFTYAGSVTDGVIIEFTGTPHITAEFFNAILHEFQGQTIPGGFNISNPPTGGLGLWVKNNSKGMNPKRLSPKHASFIASILVHEGYITNSFSGTAIILHFPERNT